MTTHLIIHGEPFSQTQQIVDWIASRTGWPIVSDGDLVDAASRRFSIPANRLERFLTKPQSAWSRLAHGAEWAAACVQSVMVDKLAEKTTVFHGSLGLPVCRQLPGVLTVLITASAGFRIDYASRVKSLTGRQARSLIRRRDRMEFEWCRGAFGEERFDTDAYDLVVPSDHLETESASRLILDQLMRCEMRTADNSASRLGDLKLASAVLLRLAKAGYHLSAAARNGRVRLTVDRPLLFFDRTAAKIKQQVKQINGVRQVQIEAGPDFFQPDVYRRCRFDLPVEAVFRSFSRCRRRLHDNAVSCFPSAVKRQIRQERASSTQQLTAHASP